MMQKAMIGKKIRDARTEKNISQSELGQSLNPERSHAAISDIERGISDISVTDLSQIATILDKPLSFFMEGMPSISMDNFRYAKDTTARDLVKGKKSVKDFDKYIDELISKDEL